uniref:pyridoxal 5'-phosphate synthase n=1 Tax=Salix viminalis TaxID=40686 RepID=A0A6N2L076_SALVM
MKGYNSPWKQLLLSAIESNSHLRHSFFFLSTRNQATIDLMADLPIAPSFSGPFKNGRLLVFYEFLRKVGFEENSDRIQINTDFRTRKIEELNHCPFAEICWYFSDSWEHSGSMEELKLSMGPIPIRKSFRPWTEASTCLCHELGADSCPWVASVVTLPPKKKGPFVSFMALLYYKSQREKLWFASSIKSRLQYLGPNLGIPCLSEQSPDEFLLGSSSGPVTTFCLLVLEPDQVDYLNLKSNQRIVPPSNRVPMEKCAGIQG